MACPDANAAPDGGACRRSQQSNGIERRKPNSLYIPSSPRTSLSMSMRDYHPGSPPPHTFPRTAPLPSSPTRNTSIQSSQYQNGNSQQQKSAFGTKDKRKPASDALKLAPLIYADDLTSSMETVKPPSILETMPDGSPLIPFPPWAEGEREPLRSQSSAVSPREDILARCGKLREERRLKRAVMHSVMLAMQCGAGLLVGSVLVWATVWQRTDSTAEFWDW